MDTFSYHRPDSLKATAAMLAAAGDGRGLAGGQTLIPTLRQRLASPSDPVDTELTQAPYDRTAPSLPE